MSELAPRELIRAYLEARKKLQSAVEAYNKAKSEVTDAKNRAHEAKGELMGLLDGAPSRWFILDGLAVHLHRSEGTFNVDCERVENLEGEPGEDEDTAPAPEVEL